MAAFGSFRSELGLTQKLQKAESEDRGTRSRWRPRPTSNQKQEVILV
jgi:hypothetical protein